MPDILCFGRFSQALRGGERPAPCPSSMLLRLNATVLVRHQPRRPPGEGGSEAVPPGPRVGGPDPRAPAEPREAPEERRHRPRTGRPGLPDQDPRGDGRVPPPGRARRPAGEEAPDRSEPPP